MPEEVLVLKKVSKNFGAVIASKDVSMKIFEAQVHALIGPNGAGKSTLIKQITGEVKEDSGKIYLGDEFTPDGCRVWDRETKKKLDKDRFRLGLGDVVESYQEIAHRLGVNLA